MVAESLFFQKFSFQIFSVKKTTMDLKLFNNADIGRVFDALHSGGILVEV